MKDAAEIYAEKNQEFSNVVNAKRPLTGQETDTMVAWARACMQHEPILPCKNTFAAKAKIVSAFGTLSREFPPLPPKSTSAPESGTRPTFRAQTTNPSVDGVRHAVKEVVHDLFYGQGELEQRINKAADQVINVATSPLGKRAFGFLKKTFG
jgi:hypothetical protein